jgi:ubiquinone/menaquinone biosynthesis C-methylase UbiE/glycosyltransferase involved in cell wall biosynthesis
MSEQDYKEFYDNLATYHKGEGNNHALGNDTYHLGTNKMRVALNYISKLPDGSNVLDLGCCVGSHTVALARLFPRLNFVGVDISKEQILIANDFAKYHNIGNVVFYDSETFDKEQVLKFNAVYCSEVLEHVVDYQAFAQKAVDYCKEEGLILFTVPSGPWEKKSDIKEHIHHFEYYDIVDVFAKQEEFFINYIPFNGELGHHVFGFRKNSNIKLGLIDFERKIKNQSPKETLSVCIITTNTVGSLEKTLKSVYEIADEIIVGVDSGDNSIDKGLSYLLEKYECDFFKIESPLVQGFDEARNATIQYATCDWVMWIDSDEIFNWPERLDFYLRNNNFDAYAIAQHHYSSEPAAKIKTDIPCRIFRNHQNITFYGVVHEHPEKVLNEGIKHVFIVPENHVSIAHNGYETEDIRRKRFQRNFPLMEKDREKYPTRTLGLFLWVRDLCHLNRFEFEKTGRHDQKAVERAREGLKIWRQFVKEGKTRFVIDLLEYVNEFSQLLTQGGAIQVSFGLNVNQIGIGDQMQQLQPINAFLETKEDVEEITRMVIQHKLDIIPEKYL